VAKSTPKRAERKAVKSRSGVPERGFIDKKIAAVQRDTVKRTDAKEKKNAPRPPAAAGVVMPPIRLTRVCRDLNSAQGWLRELSSIYRNAKRGLLDSAEASRLAYICSVASKLARDLEELKHVETLQAQLRELQGRQNNSLQWTPRAPADDDKPDADTDPVGSIIEGSLAHGNGT